VQILVPRVEREFIPILQSVPGFVSYSVIEGGVENGRDILATVSVFTNREGAEESVRRAAKWVGENLMEFDPSTPSVAAGEIVLSTDASLRTSAAYVR
jgi:hypothetical protein